MAECLPTGLTKTHTISPSFAKGGLGSKSTISLRASLLAKILPQLR